MTDTFETCRPVFKSYWFTNPKDFMTVLQKFCNKDVKKNKEIVRSKIINNADILIKKLTSREENQYPCFLGVTESCWMTNTMITCIEMKYYTTMSTFLSSRLWAKSNVGYF